MTVTLDNKYVYKFQMTVTYVQHIPNSGCWGFYRVLAKWRGSLYKVAFKQISKDLNSLLLL